MPPEYSTFPSPCGEPPEVAVGPPEDFTAHPLSEIRPELLPLTEKADWEKFKEWSDQNQELVRETPSVEGFARRQAGEIGKAGAWMICEHGLNALVPGLGEGVRVAHLSFQILEGVKSLLHGDGLEYQVPAVTFGEFSLNIEMKLFEGDPGSLELDAVWDFNDGISPSFFPGIDAAKSEIEEPVAARPDEAQRATFVRQYLDQWFDSREAAARQEATRPDWALPPAVTVRVKPHSESGCVEISTPHGRDVPATFKIHATCVRCGSIARPGPDGALRCPSCGRTGQ